MRSMVIEQVQQTAGLRAQNIVGSSDTNGLYVDRLGYLNASLIVTAGAKGGTAPPTSLIVAIRVQHSDASGSGYVDVTGYTLANLTDQNQTKSGWFGLTQLKRYIRVVVTPTFTGGTDPAVLISADWALGDRVADPTSTDAVHTAQN